MERTQKNSSLKEPIVLPQTHLVMSYPPKPVPMMIGARITARNVKGVLTIRDKYTENVVSGSGYSAFDMYLAIDDRGVAHHVYPRDVIHIEAKK